MPAEPTPRPARRARDGRHTGARRSPRPTGPDRGAVVPLVALVLPVLVLMAAFAVDLGRQRDLRRTMQAGADVISLDLVREVRGRTACELVGAGDIAAELAASAQRNRLGGTTVTVVWGHHDAATGEFVPHHQPGMAPSPGTCASQPIPTSARVLTSDTVDYAFQPGSGRADRRAVATQDDLAHLSVGSTLLAADLGDSALLNPVLTGLLCPNPPFPAPPTPLSLCPDEVDIGVAGYQGLARANVRLDDLRAAAGVGTLDELLDSEVTVAELAEIFAEALHNGGDPTTAAIFDGSGTSLAQLSGHLDTRFTLRDLVDVEVPAPTSAAGVLINPFDAFVIGAQVANGDNFVDLPVSIPPTSLPLGIANLQVTSRYQVIEAARSGIGRAGSPTTRPPRLRTAQLRLAQQLEFDLDLTVAGTGLSGRVVLPVDVQGGGADAYLMAINCAFPPEDTTIDADAVPRTLVGTIGHPTSPVGQVHLSISLPLLPPINLAAVSLRVHGEVDGEAESPTRTPLDGIAIGDTASASANELGLSGSITTASLQVAGYDVTLLNGLVRDTVNLLLAELDDALRPLLDALGTSVTRADVTNIDAGCDSVRLTG